MKYVLTTNLILSWQDICDYLKYNISHELGISYNYINFTSFIINPTLRVLYKSSSLYTDQSIFSAFYSREEMADYLMQMLSFNVFGVLFFFVLNHIIHCYRMGYSKIVKPSHERVWLWKNIVVSTVHSTITGLCMLNW